MSGRSISSFWGGGALVGTQGIDAKRFAETRRVHTGSWLGRRHQRRGIGTEMRAAVLELAFGHLGARTAASDWLAGNEASRRVSAKLGYVDVELATASPRGTPVPLHRVELHRDSWASPVGVEVDGLEPCLPLFGL
ncbi:MAG TPA: GNAT family protein [Gaiellaceae bacterium]|nr:GNAT family protein [Gaiellaceae bacterium]